MFNYFSPAKKIMKILDNRPTTAATDKLKKETAKSK